MNKVLEILGEINAKTNKLSEKYNIANPSRKTNIVYRGQANSNWSIIASLFRDGNKHLVGREHILINDYIVRFPEFDSQPRINVIADMQHYRVPTRLVDWTKNPLIALYFACNDDKEKCIDGKVFLSVKDFYMTPFQSIKIAELMCGVGGYDTKLNPNSPQSKISVDDCNLLQFAHLYAIRFYELASCFGSVEIHPDDPLGKIIKIEQYQENLIKYSQFFLKKMYGENMYYEDDVENKFIKFLKTTLTPYCFIDAPTINQRIIAQNGLFQVCNGKHYSSYDGGGYPLIKGTSYNFSEEHFVIISKVDKDKILSELDKNFNINDKTLYLKDKQELVDEFMKRVGVS